MFDFHRYIDFFPRLGTIPIDSVVLCITHMAILSVITHILNVYQTSQAFVTGSCPCCDCWCPFVLRTIECRVYPFVPNIDISSTKTRRTTSDIARLIFASHHPPTYWSPYHPAAASHTRPEQGMGRLHALVRPNAPLPRDGGIPASTWLQTTSYPPTQYIPHTFRHHYRTSPAPPNRTRFAEDKA